MEIYWKKGDFSLIDLQKELSEMKDSVENQKDWWDNVYPTLGIEYDAIGECLIFQETERQIKYLKNQISLAKDPAYDLKGDLNNFFLKRLNS